MNLWKRGGPGTRTYIFVGGHDVRLEQCLYLRKGNEQGEGDMQKGKQVGEWV